MSQVANGYYWHAFDATGLGTGAFKVPEGNGHTSFDFPQATVATQPTQLTENGSKQFRMRNSANANPSFLATAGSVQAGWATSIYLGMWLRLPDAAGIVTSSLTSYFNHNLATGNQRRLALVANNNANNALDRLTLGLNPDGATTTGFTMNILNPLAGANWVWLEAVADLLLALGGSLPVDKWKVFADFALQAQSIAPAIDIAAVFDGSSPIQIASRSAGGAANPDTTDWAACYYARGIPSLNDRIRLRNHRAPVADDWSLLTP